MNAYGTYNDSPELQSAQGGPDTASAAPGGAAASGPQPTAAPLPRKSPALAGLLSLMPGLGQVFIGYYQRGFIHLVIVASTIAVLAADAGQLAPLLGLFLAFFWLYNILDAMRLASLYNLVVQGQRGTLELEGVKLPSQGGSLAGGIVLAAAGILLLLHTRFDVPMDWIEDWWPLGVIGLGVWLALQGRRQRAR